MASPSSLPFAQVSQKAWGRLTELVVYDPVSTPSAAILEQGGQQYGVRVSDLHMDFEVTRSTSYSENTAEFKVYNASKSTREQIEAPGMRVRFSVGYQEQGGLSGIFWGSVVGAWSAKVGNSWVTTIPCVASLTESVGSEDIATWAEKNKKATLAQKEAVITRATNRIPVGMSYGPDAKVREILKNISVITGLTLYGAEKVDDILLPNGFTYVGGIRGAMDKLRQMLRAYGWNLYIDNTTLLVTPLDGGDLTVTAAFLSYGTGLLDAKPKNDMNIPPKLDRKGKRIILPKTYEFKSMLNPKIAPNTLVALKTEALDTVVLVSEVRFSGNNYGGDFVCDGVGSVYNGPQDVYRKAT